MKRNGGFVVGLILMVFLTAGIAHNSHAALAAVGPVDPANGFPTYYQDITGLLLEPCLDPVNCGLVAEPLIFNPANPVAFPNNFPSVFMYYNATARMNVGPTGAGRATMVLAVEGFFLNGPPVNGEQQTLNRIQVGPISNLAPNATYTITHPFGTLTGTTDAAGTLPRLRDQVASGAPGDFVSALGGGAAFAVVDRFLPQLAPAPPPGFIGDGGLVGNFTITPGPNGALFVLAGPSAGGAGINTVQTDLWTVTGQVAAFPLTVTNAGNGTGTVTSTSVPGAPANPVQINCGATCSATFAPATVVTLTFTPSLTSVLTGTPTGCDAGSFVVGPPATCRATMITSKTVTPTFNEAVNVTAAPASIDLGVVNVGSTVLRAVTVTNTGVTTTTGLTLGQITLTPGDFTVTSDLCSNLTLGPGANCIVDLMFTKAAVGASNATLAIPSNDPQTPTMNVTLAATGSLLPVFTDVPAGAFAEDFINTLFYNGITNGCGGTNFCPDSSITRKEMAVFLETSLGVVTAPACGGNIFADVTAASVGAAFCGYIEKLGSDGISGGCGGSNFCPDAPVTRGQMAVFIEAAIGHPANACAGQFTDATGTLVGPVACGFIEKLAADGITGGCSATAFCPNDPVTRAQMAVFLVAAPAPLIP